MKLLSWPPGPFTLGTVLVRSRCSRGSRLFEPGLVCNTVCLHSLTECVFMALVFHPYSNMQLSMYVGWYAQRA